MSTADVLIKRPRLQPLKLPKFFHGRPFRIRSVSKQKLDDPSKVVIKDNTSGQKLYTSNDKYRSSSLKSTKSKKSITRKSQTNNISSDEQVLQARSCKNNSKIACLNSKQAMELEHKKNMQKLFEIATIFDPKRIMKMGRKNSQHSHEESKKQIKSKNIKSHFRHNQYIFQSNGCRNKKERNNQLRETDEYWKKVNQSLILPIFKSGEVEVSKDLRQIYQILATQ